MKFHIENFKGKNGIAAYVHCEDGTGKRPPGTNFIKGPKTTRHLGGISPRLVVWLLEASDADKKEALRVCKQSIAEAEAANAPSKPAAPPVPPTAGPEYYTFDGSNVSGSTYPLSKAVEMCLADTGMQFCKKGEQDWVAGTLEVKAAAMQGQGQDKEQDDEPEAGPDPSVDGNLKDRFEAAQA